MIAHTRLSPRGQKSRRRQRGFTLIEMLTVIAVTSIALTSIAVALGVCVRADRNLAAQTKFGRSLHQLAMQWRNDVHSAQTIRLPSAIETTEGAKVEYAFHAEQIERRVVRGEQVTHREAYAIPTGFSVAITVEGDARKTAVLTVRPPDDPKSPTSMVRVERRFEAVLPAQAMIVNPRRRRRPAGTPRSFFGRQSLRRGAILVGALVCFLVISMLAATAAQRIVQQFREGKRRAQQWQAEWLAESGAQRAVARLKSDANYSGETWNVASSDLGVRSDPTGGQVVIEVSASPDDATKRVIRILARYPAEEIRGVARHREFIVPTSAMGVSQ